MSFDEIFDLTAGVYFRFYYMFRVMRTHTVVRAIGVTQSVQLFELRGNLRYRSWMYF